MSKVVVATYELSEPVAWCGETISKLEFRAPKYKHFKAVEHHQFEPSRMAELVSILSDRPLEVIDELSLADALGVTELLTPFLTKTKGKTTGQTRR